MKKPEGQITKKEIDSCLKDYAAEYRSELVKKEIKEERIRGTIEASKKAFWEADRTKYLTRLEFLWTQTQYIKKRWWIFQMLILVMLWSMLYVAESNFYIQRSMGVAAVLFVVMILPELWRSKNAGFLEIEGASYFSLRQIYAARFLLFGIVDVVLLSGFAGIVSFSLQITVCEMLVQFFLPLNVACCICFQTLCSRWFKTEYAAVSLCLLWMTVWLFLIMQESVYQMITRPLWAGMLTGSFVYLFFMVYRVLKNCKKEWEGSPIWN